MGRMRNLALVAALLLAGCGPDPPPAPTAPASAFDGPTSAEVLDETTLADEVLDGEVLLGLLDDTGFAGGTVRTWEGSRETGIRGVEARALRFDSVDAAETYLAWVEGHPEDLIGSADPVRVGGGVAFVHEPAGCCPNKDTTRVLAAWTAGGVAWTVVVSGPATTVADATAVMDAIEVDV